MKSRIVLVLSVLVEEQSASDISKVAYMKEFMYKYRGPAGASDWTGKVNTAIFYEVFFIRSHQAASRDSSSRTVD